MAGRYQKQKENKYARLKRKKAVPKAQQGMMVPESQPVPGGMDGFSSVTSMGQTGAEMGSVAGPAGKIVGGVVGTGVGAATYFQRKKQAKAENARIEKLQDNFRRHGNVATDPKLMTSGDLAQDGLDIGKEGLIEIEGKEGIGELHFDEDYNLKNVGTTPHTSGGDKVVAEEGDVVFPVQGDAEEQQEILSLVKKAKQGNERAYAKLEKERNELPQGNKTDKYPDGDGDIDLEGSQLTWGDQIVTNEQYDNLFSMQIAGDDTGVNNALYEYGIETESPTEEQQARINAFEELNSTLDFYGAGGDGIIPVDEQTPAEKLATRESGLQTNNASGLPFPQSSTMFKSGDTDIPLDESGYTGYYQDAIDNLGKGNLGSGIYLDESGLPVNEDGNPVSTQFQERLYDEYATPPEGLDHDQLLDAVSTGQYNWSPKQLQAAAKNAEVDYNEMKGAMMEADPTLTDADFGKGKQDKLSNIGPKTTGLASRNYAAPDPTPIGEIYDNPLPSETPIGTTDPKIAAAEAEATGADPEAAKKAAKQRKKDGQGLNNLLRRGNAIQNMLDSFSGIEGYNMTPLELERYKYQDMSAPRLREAEKYNMVRRANRQRLVGSKGQQVTQAAQDEVMAQQAADRIVADETGRKMQLENMNVDLSNMENRHATQEMITGKNTERAQRAAARNLRRLGTAEFADIADLDQQKDYMMSRDAKADAMDSKLYKMMSENATREYTLENDDLYDDEGNLSDFNVITREQKERKYKTTNPNG